MTITQVTPDTSLLSQDEISALFQTGEYHSVPFEGIRVECFKDDALRETVAQYWGPGYGVGYDFVLYQVSPCGAPRGHRVFDADAYLVEVEILLTYPLNHPWSARMKLPVDRLGEVFAVAHDMYKHIYDLDAEVWKAEGHDAVPRVSERCTNRAHGRHVWGHDMSDLVFESVLFILNPDWPIDNRPRKSGRKRFSLRRLFGRAPKVVRYYPLPGLGVRDADQETCERSSGLPEFLGTFSFGIGS